MESIYEACGLTCVSCGKASWSAAAQAITCRSCGFTFPVEDGVLILCSTPPSDGVFEFYSTMGGIHFLGASFAENPVVYCTTRSYQNFLERHLIKPTPVLLDFGCGDGRFSLWAAANNAGTVVALDSNLAALKRLATEVRKRGLTNVLIICADARQPVFRDGSFDAVICFEVLYYLVAEAGRLGALKAAANLIKSGGTLILGEFTRYGRAVLDIAAMNLENAQSLAKRHTRFEKLGALRVEVFQWTVAELKQDCGALGLELIAEAGISPIAALFSHAWTFTSYPLRPPLDPEIQRLIEDLSDATQEVSETARNVALALRKA